MKCMFIGISGIKNEQMLEGFNIDLNFPCEKISIPQQYNSLANELKNCQIYIQILNNEYYLDIEKKDNKFEIINNEKYKLFFKDLLFEKLPNKQIEKRLKL